MRKSLFSAAVCAILSAMVCAQAQIKPLKVESLFPKAQRAVIYPLDSIFTEEPVDLLQLLRDENTALADSLALFPEEGDDYIVEENALWLPDYYFRPMVFDTYQFMDSMALSPQVPLHDPVYGWLATDFYHSALVQGARQSMLVNRPDILVYDQSKLPEPPKKYEAHIDPSTAKIVVAEVINTDILKPEFELEYEKRHWLRKFTGNLQFSQAYVSPNWYQGGNNNLNLLASLYYYVKLNPAYHKKLLFENTLQYKLGFNNAPDDKLRNYRISDDLFQLNTLLGYKASKKWYYSMTVQFKTQFLRNFKANTNTLQAALFSPGELNVGLGMTYNFVNPKKTFTFDASISPVSYNLKTCLNKRVNPTAFGIKAGHNTVSEVGSSAEAKLMWQICSTISLRSRLFCFTDYKYIYGDWENTLQMNVTKYLTTQIYVHMRYDSSTPRCDDADWHKFQLKEILSFGFTYAFSTP